MSESDESKSKGKKYVIVVANPVLEKNVSVEKQDIAIRSVNADIGKLIKIRVHQEK